MPIEPPRRIADAPVIKSGESTSLSQKKKPKQQKKEGEKEQGKVDITV